MNADSFVEYLLGRKEVAAVVIGGCAFVSLCLIARLWVLHRRDTFFRKLVWSVVLLLPLLGSLFFAAFYRPAKALGWTGRAEHGIGAEYADPGASSGAHPIDH